MKIVVTSYPNLIASILLFFCYVVSNITWKELAIEPYDLTLGSVNVLATLILLIYGAHKLIKAFKILEGEDIKV